MRPVHLSDLHMAALILRNHPQDQRVALITQVLEAADTADRYRKKLRRGHPDFGTGTLSSAIRGFQVDRAQAPCETAYLEALQVVVAALLAKRQNYPKTA